MNKASGKEINSVVAYIGGEGGYLANFTYANHAQFYPLYCGLDIDTNAYEGTTRIRFITILNQAKPHEQAKIMQGVLDKIPFSSFEYQLEDGTLIQRDFNNKKRLFDEITKWIEQLKGNGLVEMEELIHSYEFVEETLNQCQTLILQHSSSAALDRAHTALHGYFKKACEDAGLNITENNPKIQDYWSKIRREHPNFQIDVKEYHSPISQMVGSIAKLLENLNEARNNHAFSHPNEDIMGEEEAKFCINLFRSILQYVDRKVSK
jgi:hypothetical protein